MNVLILNFEIHMNKPQEQLLIISIGKQGLEQRKLLKERVFLMLIFFGESNGFSFQKLPAFEIIGTKVKDNKNNVLG